MPLAAGNDLKPRLMRAVEGHVAACPGCRQEFEALRAAMAVIKAAVKAEGVADWSESEWRAAMARVAAEARGRREGREAGAGSTLKPRWAPAAALGAIAGLTVLFLLFRGPAPRPEPNQTAGGLIVASTAAEQDRVSITLVSRETGLQVVWFLDKDFDYKGEKE
jgi:hypothetical protein